MGILIDMSTPECDWQRCERLRETRRVPLAGIVPVGRRLVIVSPHPDDEVLSAGGLLADCLAERRRAHVVAVTDGEASHPGSALWTPQTLRSARSRERARALAVLGAAPDTLVRMGLPDGAVGAHRAALERGLDDQLDEHDIVVTPWRHDGHPDHEAVTAAVLAVQQRCAFEVWEAPIWMWQWERPSSMRIPWHRARRFFPTPLARARKQTALTVFASQRRPDPSLAGTPILPDSMLAHFGRPFEAFFAPHA